jgi:Helicase HerA, central domain
MKTIEKTGAFYLGKNINTEQPVFYDSKDLTTHAVCVGMTGSGKTGLGIALLEDAAIDQIPAIIIDPKGDLGNLMLAFPSLSAQEFLPWIDPAEAERKGKDLKAYAEIVAAEWKKGLASWDEGPDRVRQFKNSAETVIYTPASKAGIPLSILSSFAAPSKEMMSDTAAVRDRVLSTTSGLLGLLGISADPIKSREHILISTIITKSWEKGVDLDIPTLVREVQTPPFTKVGVLDIDTFYPAKDRLALSISLNNLLASPGFQAWMEGDPLDIDQLLHTPEGKPKLSIISIAHLSDSERMFFVTLLLNQLLTWMRRQSGTSALRAIFYMDEIYGYFPPTSMPPSKVPMITLLKQARAFGLGVVLSTQNPVDLDYKGLANCGTWFIGKLQTERDKARVLEGLTIASNGEIQAKELDKMLASAGNRVFIMRSIYQKEPVVFQTRWTLSYLRGPLTLAQIAKLNDRKEEKAVKPVKAASVSEATAKPFVGGAITEYFLRSDQAGKPVHYQAKAVGFAKLHFVDSKNRIDTWNDVCMVAPLKEDGQTVDWPRGQSDKDLKDRLGDSPEANCTYGDVPSAFVQNKNNALEKDFAAYLYQNQVLTIYKSPELNVYSKEGESEEAFRNRIDAGIREKNEKLVDDLKAKYGEKIAVLTERARRAEEKMTSQKRKWWIQIGETIASVITTIIGAFLGKGVTKGTLSQTGVSMRKAGRITKENQEASQAEESLNIVQDQLQELKNKLQAEVDQVQKNGANMQLESIEIRPRKSDISIEKVALVWSN